MQVMIINTETTQSQPTFNKEDEVFFHLTYLKRIIEGLKRNLLSHLTTDNIIKRYNINVQSEGNEKKVKSKINYIRKNRLKKAFLIFNVNIHFYWLVNYYF